jgi:putative addiction module killer protein
VQQSTTFSTWLGELDASSRGRIVARIRRIELGNLGDWKSVGEGVSELRFDFGPGYRVYFARRGREMIILLAGGDKGSQAADIRRAQEMFRSLDEER